MSDYHLVSTLHTARVTLADALKAGDAAAVAAAEAQVAAARAAVNTALADGRVTSSKHMLDLDLDCLGAVLSRLGPEDAFYVSHTCTTLRSALFRGGLPGPLAGVRRKTWQREDTAADAAAALLALDAMEPALGALRLKFKFHSLDEGHARVLTRALDAAPRAARIDITLMEAHNMNGDDAGRLIDILLSPDRVFAAPPQVHLGDLQSFDGGAIPRLARAGVCVASIEQCHFEEPNLIERITSNVANTLTRLEIQPRGAVNLMTRFPALRQLIMDIIDVDDFTTDMPSLTALAPHLKEITLYSSAECEPLEAGFGYFQPPLFARFVAAIQGVTRLSFDDELGVTLSQNENENLGQMTALRTLRDLSVGCGRTYVALDPLSSRPGPPRDPVAEDAITNLPLLPPGLTRLALSGDTRVKFCHPLPELRVLDWRLASTEVICGVFNMDERERVQNLVERHLHVPLAIPSAAIAPNLHTLLIGCLIRQESWNFDLWTLVSTRTALRTVVIVRMHLLCGAPDGFDTTMNGFAAKLSCEAKNLVSVHTHDCVIADAHAENFLRAVEERGGRVCRAGVGECLFCILHDGTDVWLPWLELAGGECVW